MLIFFIKGGYPDLNREHIEPHTITLPLSYIHLNNIKYAVKVAHLFDLLIKIESSKQQTNKMVILL